MSTPAEVWHLLQGSISEFPLKEFVDMRWQEVTDLHTNKQANKQLILWTESGGEDMTIPSAVPDILVTRLNVNSRYVFGA